MNPRKPQLSALTGLRFFLALWVLVYHQIASVADWLPGPSFLGNCFNSPLHAGYSAVTAFFILSGFVLTYTYDLAALRMPANLRRFAVARFTRIYPIYLAALLCLLPFGVYRLITGVFKSSPDSAASFVLNVVLLQAWIPPDALTWNYPGWSLSNEAFFYALLPFVGLWFYRAEQGMATRSLVFSVVRLLVPLWILSCALPLVGVATHLVPFSATPGAESAVADTDMWPNLIRYNPLSRLPEFFIGVVLAGFYRIILSRGRFANRGYLFYIPGVILVLGLLSQANRLPYPLLHNGLIAPAYALIILGLALGGGALVRLLSTRSLVFLGNASYTMYILHAPIYTWLRIIWVRGFGISPAGPLWFCSYLLTAVGLPCLIFRMAEEPLHRRLKQLWNREVLFHSVA
jgi:peptidoglycan/LPS O-acetylase OafA/YrhL